MKTYLINKQKALKIPKKWVVEVVNSVTLGELESFEEVAIHLVTKSVIADIHKEYFDDPSPTDCITFPVDEKGVPFRMLGDVFVCPEVAIEYANLHQLDPFQETTLYIVHGMLHLFGYDDMTVSDRKKMKIAEKRHMLRLFP